MIEFTGWKGSEGRVIELPAVPRRSLFCFHFMLVIHAQATAENAFVSCWISLNNLIQAMQYDNNFPF
jgi:hypothetical protein